METRVCPGCKQSLPPDAYGFCATNAHGRATRCKVCRVKDNGDVAKRQRAAKRQRDRVALMDAAQRRADKGAARVARSIAWHASVEANAIARAEKSSPLRPMPCTRCDSVLAHWNGKRWTCEAHAAPRVTEWEPSGAWTAALTYAIATPDGGTVDVTWREMAPSGRMIGEAAWSA